jgi:hypothetical protein
MMSLKNWTQLRRNFSRREGSGNKPNHRSRALALEMRKDTKINQTHPWFWVGHHSPKRGNADQILLVNVCAIYWSDQTNLSPTIEWPHSEPPARWDNSICPVRTPLDIAQNWQGLSWIFLPSFNGCWWWNHHPRIVHLFHIDNCRGLEYDFLTIAVLVTTNNHLDIRSHCANIETNKQTLEGAECGHIFATWSPITTPQANRGGFSELEIFAANLWRNDDAAGEGSSGYQI